MQQSLTSSCSWPGLSSSAALLFESVPVAAAYLLTCGASIAAGGDAQRATGGKGWVRPGRPAGSALACFAMACGRRCWQCGNQLLNASSHCCRIAAGIHSRPRPCCVLRGQDAVQNRYRRQIQVDRQAYAFLRLPVYLLTQLLLTPVYHLLPAAVEEVPDEDYEIPLGKARVVHQGSDITLVGWGQQVRVLELAVSERRSMLSLLDCCSVSGNPAWNIMPMPRLLLDVQAREVQERDGISCELLDLRTLLPWDAAAVEASVNKTGRWAGSKAEVFLF